MTLVAEGLARTFKRQVAVVEADITLVPGQITGLVGPNGAGKTTLLLMLAGLLQPSDGSIRIDGEVVDPVRLRERVGWMPDVFGTWESLTAQEILIAFARLHGRSIAQARQRAAALLAEVHLTDFAGRPAQELSRGQKQRLGFARALVHEPRVLLLDEPASGMDPRSRVELRDSLRALADGGCAVLVSSHILSELGELVDHVVMMRAGCTTPPPAALGSTWRIRLLGQPVGASTQLTFADDDEAAQYLAHTVGSGTRVLEFARATSALEDAYFALEAERT
ncbi:ABC transporter ATP-binding protein [Mycobacteroides chelonae]|uniref:ABC transporter n=1 Tax=Mycobacteroides chelonae TaxID=1774 RepID=A0A1S1M4R2_MYCCH|nr:ABC transporter ATP-binding protein [Mycobacteroides chelonae]OHU80084.1 ABC transporter [Mycobacteroides chelonae]QQG88863.1 ABC transporter ATP-binding protein [Mycobacteroides chelonae]QQG93677.1 ABC transporter ATP-binding protein [Mycobacteroides chelonae]